MHLDFIIIAKDMAQTDINILNKLNVFGVTQVNSTLALVLKSLGETRLGRHLNCVVETDIESNGPKEEDFDLLH